MRKLLTVLFTIGMLYSAHSQNAATAFTKGFNQALQNGANIAAIRASRAAAEANRIAEREAQGFDLKGNSHWVTRDVETEQVLNYRGNNLELPEDVDALNSDITIDGNIITYVATVGTYKFEYKIYKDNLILNLKDMHVNKTGKRVYAKGFKSMRKRLYWNLYGATIEIGKRFK